jgi:enoyl-CoA hydratase/carnithine racemase
MTYAGIDYEAQDRVATITLNRVETKNALDQAALDAFVAAVQKARADDDVWLIEVRARGKDFCAGHDIRDIVEHRSGGDYFNPVCQALRGTFKPIICAARGLCLGGGAGIVLACDVRIISSTTRMGWPHARLGICSANASASLPRAVPVNVALELMFTADTIDADRIFGLGIANHVVQDEQLESFAASIRQKILANAPLAVRAAKEATLTTRDLTYAEAANRAREMHDALMASADAREGLRAFLEKRRPLWKAR